MYSCWLLKHVVDIVSSVLLEIICFVCLLLRNIIDMFSADRRGLVIYDPAAYLEGPEFKFRSEDRISWLMCRGFPQSLQANAEIEP
jgi:hypothetical protein